MSADTVEMVACTIVSSRPDYCNSLLPGMSDANFTKLERFQYDLAHMVTGMPTYSRGHMKPNLTILHWLPIRAWVTFIITTIVFKIRRTRQPSYLAELIKDHVPFDVLWLTICRQSILKESKTASVTGARSFRYTAAKTWNSLSDNIRLDNTLWTFRTRLKHIYIDYHIYSFNRFVLFIIFLYVKR